MGSRFTGDSQDPAVNVTTWLLMVIMVFSTTTRFGTKFHLFRRLMVDDLLIFASLVFGIAQGIAISLAVAAGYGYHYTTVSNARLDQVMKVRISQLPRDLLPPSLFFTRQAERLTLSSTEPLRGVSSLHPEPGVLQTIPGRVHPQPHPDRKG
jgi:hypothetical protein